MSSPKTSPDLLSAISLLGLAAGRRQHALQGGRSTASCGPGLLPASLSPTQASKKGLTMNGIYGPTIFDSSALAAPRSPWASRLAQRLASIGSIECILTWRPLVTPGGGLVIPTCSINAPCRRDRLWWLFAPEGAVGHTNSARLERHAGDGRHAGERTHADRPVSPASVSLDRPWHDTEDWIGHDGKRRRLEPRSKPVGFGIPRSVEQLRAYGNAINPYLGAEVLAAWVECQP